MVLEFGYYKTILRAMKDKQPFPVYRVNQIGGRMGSKTWSGIEFVIYASLIAKTKTDAYRWTKGKDRQELFNQIGAIIETFPGLKSKVLLHKSDMTYTFPNGSVIEVSGLRKMGSNEVQLTGKSGASQFEYQIALAEERYEIPDESWGDVLQAIRGTDNFMELHLANPWVFTNDYVKYCNDNMAFNLEELAEYGQQYKIIKKEIKTMDGNVFKYKEIFHYTNYQINSFISLADKVKLEQAAKHDPHRANTILYGYPGTPKGSIWKWVLPKMKQIPREPSVHFVGGVDYGERADATTGYVIGFDAGNSHAHVMHEYYWKNQELSENRDTNVLAETLVNHFLDFMEEHIGFQNSLQIMVDGSAIPFIVALNTYTQSIGYDNILSFTQQTNKGKVADRIETMRTMASFGLITVDKECPELLRELSEQTYADKSRTSIDYVNGDDHGTDAMYYGIEVKWIELQENMKYIQIEENKEANNAKQKQDKK